MEFNNILTSLRNFAGNIASNFLKIIMILMDPYETVKLFKASNMDTG